MTAFARRVARRARHELGFALKPALERLGFDVLEKRYYSPVPRVEELPAGFWDRTASLHGVDLDSSKSLKLLEEKLAPFVAEFHEMVYPDLQAGGFSLENEAYESVDAEVLYAMIREQRPSRVFELGSGYSSALIHAACEANAAAGAPSEYVVYDPYPRLELTGRAVERLRVVPLGARDIPLAEFESLGEGDVLFVDTTHTVKVGSEVNHLVLEVLPTLAPGVLVHFHDIFLPREYPRTWVEDRGFFWAEQYLLHAFLAFNETYEIVFAANAVAHEFPERVARVVPSFGQGVEPGAFWLRRAREVGAG